MRKLFWITSIVVTIYIFIGFEGTAFGAVSTKIEVLP
jgi:hypothetical protein